MKRVVKSHPPNELRTWLEANKETNHAYGDLLGTSAHKALKLKLLEEQGWLCAYTGQSIMEKSSHVEHVKPQNKCNDWEDVEYRNVVACFPADGGDNSHGYGAPVKGGWWDADLFVSPLSIDCERRFRFAWSGHVHPNPDDNDSATKTIKVLQLDSTTLRQLRKARIDGFFGFGSRAKSRPLSIGDAKAALASIEQRDSTGRLLEFCFVLKQLLTKFVEKGGG